MFSQVPQTSAIPEDPFHFRIILDGVFGFLGSLPFFGILAAQYIAVGAIHSGRIYRGSVNV
jgi:hypothetical protein